MPILTAPRALPGLLMSLVKYLEVRGPMLERQLFARAVPAAFRKANGEGAAEITFRETVEVGHRIGLLQTDGDMVTVAEGVGLAGSDRPAEDFLLAWILDESVAGTAPFAQSEGPAADLVRTLCWFLDLDPMEHPIFTGNRKENAPQTRLEMLVPDAALVDQLRVADAAWNTFARWAVYLGFARTVPGRAVGVIPDPYVAVRRAAPMVLTKRNQAIQSALVKLGGHISVIGGGPVAEQWHGLHRPDEDRDVSPALSHALYRLHVEERVKLATIGDGEVWRLRFGRRTSVHGYDGPVKPQVATYSHISLGA